MSLRKVTARVLTVEIFTPHFCHYFIERPLLNAVFQTLNLFIVKPQKWTTKMQEEEGFDIIYGLLSRPPLTLYYITNLHIPCDD